MTKLVSKRMIRQWKRRWQRWSQWWCKRWWQWCHQKWWHRLVFTQWFCCSWFFCISVYLYFELQWGGGHPHQLGCIGLHLNRPELCYDYSIIIVYLYFLVFVFLYLVIFIGCIWTVQNYVMFIPSSLCILFFSICIFDNVTMHRWAVIFSFFVFPPDLCDDNSMITMDFFCICYFGLAMKQLTNTYAKSILCPQYSIITIKDCHDALMIEKGTSET